MPHVFINLFTRFNDAFNPENVIFMNTLTYALEFLQGLMIPMYSEQSADQDSPNANRTYTLSTQELQELLQWEQEQHPLKEIEKLLKAYVNTDETENENEKAAENENEEGNDEKAKMNTLHESVAAIVHLLDTKDETPPTGNFSFIHA